MFRRKPKKKYTIGQFFVDAATVVAAAGVCAVSYVVEKVSDAV